MPRKRILAKEEVLDTALKITEEKGVEALSSRSLAMALHTSTQPLFTLFHGMEEILSGVKEKAYAVYDGQLLAYSLLVFLKGREGKNRRTLLRNTAK
jgi:AcrR family transcriptional regulator